MNWILIITAITMTADVQRTSVTIRQFETEKECVDERNKTILTGKILSNMGSPNRMHAWCEPIAGRHDGVPKEFQNVPIPKET